jgi:glycosyltransferase involved in cell wall biosynthesis
MGITAVILAKNEEVNIKECIKSVKFCDEILVIDDDSTDKTIEIAKSAGAKVIRHPLMGDYATQKNFALSKALNKWVLFVDADERVSDTLRDEIMNVVEIPSNPYIGYRIKRHKYLWGKPVKYGDSRDDLLRLGKRNAGKWMRRVHEYWEMPGRVGKLSGKILHYPHRTLKEYIDHVDFFSGLHAKNHYKEGTKSNIFKILFLPPAKFIQNYIIRLSVLDGTRGFLVSMMMSLHSFLAWSKLWLLQKHIEQ